MSPQERELLANFLEQMNQTQAGQKDPDADAMIRTAVGRQPDAPYLLVQRALALDYALQAAQAETAKLKAELEKASANGPGFMQAANSWGRGAASTAAPVAGMGSAMAAGQSAAAAPHSAPAAAPMAAQAAQAAPAARSGWGGGGSMLGTIATTAAGVVAGSFLFQGIQGLMGNHGNKNPDSAANQANQSGLGADSLADATPVRDDSLAEAQDLEELSGDGADYGGDSSDSA